MDLQTITLAAAITTIITLLITFIWEFVLNKTKKAVARKKKELNESVKKVIKECLDPIYNRLNSMEQDSLQVKKGLQSELRLELREKYQYWIKKGYAPTVIREDLENLYWAYHSLGKNGVMDDLRDKFLNLPLDKNQIKENN